MGSPIVFGLVVGVVVVLGGQRVVAPWTKRRMSAAQAEDRARAWWRMAYPYQEGDPPERIGATVRWDYTYKCYMVDVGTYSRGREEVEVQLNGRVNPLLGGRSLGATPNWRPLIAYVGLVVVAALLAALGAAFIAANPT
jgi:hypothetical protein